MSHTRFLTAIIIVLAAAILRLVDIGGMNFAPIGAVAVFCGLTFRNKWLAFGLPLCATLVNDVSLAVQNNYDFGTYLFTPIMLFVYAGWVLYGCSGLGVRRIWSKTKSTEKRTLALCGGSLLGSVAFFVVTNLGVWCVGPIHTLTSLTTCFVQAIPFFRGTLISDSLFLAAMMATYVIVTHLVADKQESQSPLLYAD